MNIIKWIIYTICGFFVASAIFCITSLAYASFESVSANSLEQRITDKKKALDEATKKEATFSEWRNIKENFDSFKNDYLIGMDDFSRFRDELQVVFNKYQFVTKIPEYKYKRFFRDYMQVTISFSVSGSYPNIKRFIHEIMNREKMIVIRSIQFNKTLQLGDIEANFVMEVYLAM